MSAMEQPEHGKTNSRMWVKPLIALASLISIITGCIGWTTNTLNWQMTLMNSAIGLSVVAWVGVIAVATVTYLRETLVADTIKALRLHEAEQWSRAARNLSVDR